MVDENGFVEIDGTVMRVGIRRESVEGLSIFYRLMVVNNWGRN